MPAPRSLFFFNCTATTEIYTLSLHDALPICPRRAKALRLLGRPHRRVVRAVAEAARHRPYRPLSDPPPRPAHAPARSEEHTSELQSRQYLVCRLLLEKKQLATTNSCCSSLAR